ncbi:MAG: protein-L-isoaspartate(D-aspartate) O-methyltransferase [Bacteroidota bacterium]
MPRFDDERKDMIKLLRERGIADDRILNAMMRVERHSFLNEPFLNRAYEDTALPIGRAQTISQPFTVAFMTQELDHRPGMKVLEVGTGSGYQAAILAELGCKVYTIERHLDLLNNARKLFEKKGYRIMSRGGDGTVGWSEFAPYDGIIVTAGAPEVPQPLLDQLADGGRLVIPVGDLTMQKLRIVTKTNGEFETKDIHGFKFVPLIGKKGWEGK